MNILMRRSLLGFCFAGILSQGALQAEMPKVLEEMRASRDAGRFYKLRALLEAHYFKSSFLHTQINDFVLESANTGYEIFDYWHFRATRWGNAIQTDFFRRLLARVIINMVLVKSSMDACALVGHHDPAWTRDTNPFTAFLYNYHYRLVAKPVCLLDQDKELFGYRAILEHAKDIWTNEYDFDANAEKLQKLLPPVSIRCFSYGTSYIGGYGTDVYCIDAMGELEDIWRTQTTVRPIMKSIFVERLTSFDKTWKVFDSFRDWQEFFAYKPELRPIGAQETQFGLTESVAPTEMQNMPSMPVVTTPPIITPPQVTVEAPAEERSGSEQLVNGQVPFGEELLNKVAALQLQKEADLANVPQSKQELVAYLTGETPEVAPSSSSSSLVQQSYAQAATKGRSTNKRSMSKKNK